MSPSRRLPNTAYTTTRLDSLRSVADVDLCLGRDLTSGQPGLFWIRRESRKWTPEPPVQPRFPQQPVPQCCPSRKMYFDGTTRRSIKPI